MTTYAKVIAFVNSNTTTGLEFLKRAAAAGFQPVLLVDSPARFAAAATLTEIITVDTSDAKAVLAAIAHRNVGAVMTSSEYYLETAAIAARRLRLPGPNPTCVANCCNKSKQRAILAKAGVRQPRFQELTGSATTASVAAAVKAVGGPPVVLKPVYGSGSCGVRLVEDAQAIDRAVIDLLHRRCNERGVPVKKSAVLLEEYIDGPAFSVELFDGHAVGVTQNLLSRPPYFLQLGHNFPAPISPRTRHTLIKTAEDAATALGLMFGPLHIELRLDKHDSAAVIEVNARLAGGYIPRLMELCGLDLIAKTIAAATGTTAPPAPEPIAPAAAIRFLVMPTDGRFDGVVGMGRARSMPGVTDLEVYIHQSECIRIHGDFRDRVGHIIATGPSPAAAGENADNALARTKVLCAHERTVMES